MSTQNTYTAFVQHMDGRGTIWIESVYADSIEDAKRAAIEACANAWECSPMALHLLGLARGIPEILFWDDIE